MKKLLMLMGAAGMLITACDPNEEIYDELDQAKGKATAVFEHTLTSSEYADAIPDDDNDPIGRNKYFTSKEEASTYIPNILDEVYSYLGGESKVLVYYSIPAGNGQIQDVTATAADYQKLGGEIASNGYINGYSDLPFLLDAMFPYADEQSVYNITYNYKNMEDVRNSVYVKSNGSWIFGGSSSVVELSDDDYIAMGLGQYKNFDDTDDVIAFLPTFAAQNKPYAADGDNLIIEYKFYNKGLSTRYAVLTKKDGAWVFPASKNQQSLQFGYEDGKWVPDNTIVYSLVPADYTEIANLADSDPTLVDDVINLRRFGNFNLGNWKADVILEYIIKIIEQKYPNMDEGQKFDVSYSYFSNGYGIATEKIILKDGEYVRQD